MSGHARSNKRIKVSGKPSNSSGGATSERVTRTNTTDSSSEKSRKEMAESLVHKNFLKMHAKLRQRARNDFDLHAETGNVIQHKGIQNSTQPEAVTAHMTHWARGGRAGPIRARNRAAEQRSRVPSSTRPKQGTRATSANTSTTNSSRTKSKSNSNSISARTRLQLRPAAPTADNTNSSRTNSKSKSKSNSISARTRRQLRPTAPTADNDNGNGNQEDFPNFRVGAFAEWSWTVSRTRSTWWRCRVHQRTKVEGASMIQVEFLDEAAADTATSSNPAVETKKRKKSRTFSPLLPLAPLVHDLALAVPNTELTWRNIARV